MIPEAILALAMYAVFIGATLLAIVTRVWRERPPDGQAAGAGYLARLAGLRGRKDLAHLLAFQFFGLGIVLSAKYGIWGLGVGGVLVVAVEGGAFVLGERLKVNADGKS